jgi:hypothetical protein
VSNPQIPVLCVGELAVISAVAWLRVAPMSRFLSVKDGAKSSLSKGCRSRARSATRS